jgi:hypothetical protein
VPPKFAAGANPNEKIPNQSAISGVQGLMSAVTGLSQSPASGSTGAIFSSASSFISGYWNSSPSSTKPPQTKRN